MSNPADITTLLAAFAGGNREAADELVPLVYDELRKIARNRRYRWHGPQTPGTTSLVHEAYVNLVDQSRCQLRDRSHFFYFASVAMRNILIDNARRWGRQKRAGDAHALALNPAILASVQRAEELLAVDEALARLGASNERLGRIVECRFFGGLTVQETADALSLSAATVKRGWDLARVWLFKELGPLPARPLEQDQMEQ